MEDPTFPALGKIDAPLFERHIAGRLGAPAPETRVPPKTGVDAGIVSIGDGRVMAITTDPFFVEPRFGMGRAGWFAVHILASDLATTGLAPRYLSVDLNLPLEITEAELNSLWGSVSRTCEELGVSVITGHTGRYPGCAYPMVGGATMLAFGAENGFVSVGMSRPGDVVIMTKSAAVEAAALFASGFPARVEGAYGSRFAVEADALFEEMSVVRDAFVAAGVGLRDGGVTAMHDATEGGVVGGLVEMAAAAGIGMTIDRRAIFVDEHVGAICELFGIDPLIAISEGTLLLTCRPAHAERVVQALSDASIRAAILGTCESERGVRLVDGGEQTTLVHPMTDPFWAAWGRALAEAWA
jgi:hydrogenase maturation factor